MIPPINDTHYIINPITNQPVKVGSKTFNKLVKNGMMEAENVPRFSRVVYRGNSKIECKMQLNELNKSFPLPENKYYSLDNTGKSILIKQKKARVLRTEEIIENISRASLNALTKMYNLGEYSNEDHHSLIYLINQELVNKNVNNNLSNINIDEHKQQIFTTATQGD